jgi:XTP/dITP diphosphohydrolase
MHAAQTPIRWQTMGKLKVLRFLSSNPHKLREAQQILEPKGFTIVPITYRVEELQTKDLQRIVRDKLIKAFSYSGRPLIVEHTGLYLGALNGFPGGLTQVFWETVGADRFAALFGVGEDVSVVARTFVGFTDGQSIQIVEGEVSGKVSPQPRGNRDFQWDCVFIPEGYDKTFAELGDVRKNQISMRRQAFDRLATLLGST